MEFTSGELLYRINVDSYKNGFPEISTEFWDFLNEELTNNPIDNSSNFNNTTYKIHSDDQTNRNSSSNSYSNNYTVTNSNSDGNSYNNTNAKSINNSSTISSNIIETYKTKINQYQKLLITIKTIINKNKNEFEYEKTRLHTQLLLLKQKYDGCLMELTLEYYNIIMSELYTTKQQVLCEQRDVQLLYKHAKILRDIEMFSVHLSLETKKNVTLVLLPNDSQQFNRCCKAVMDNIKPVLFGESPNNSYASPNKSGNSYSNSGDKSNHDTMNLMNNTRILNVFKLQNNYLANNLTELSKTITTGKIKGLFCNFLPNRLQTFSVFGLSSQKLPVDNYSDIKSLGSQYFRKPWFYYSPKHLQENNDTENGTRAGIYTPRATNNIHNQQEINNLTKVQGTAAKLSMKKHNDLILRFSRHSASENLYKYSDSDLETGVILALCRVLIVNQMTISETITDEHIIQAYEKNCDALYSTLT